VQTLAGVKTLAPFAGQTWLDPLNNTAYYPVVLAVNGMLAAWFFHLAATSGKAVPDSDHL
jgi:hypothetical protein